MTERSSRGIRIFRAIVILGLLLIFLASLEIFSRFFLEAAVADGVRQEIEVNIPMGASVKDIAVLLHDAGLVEHPRLFRMAVRLLGADTKIQAGIIRVPAGQSMIDLIGSLTRTKAAGVPVFIREGLTSMQIAALLHAKLGMDSAQVMSAIKDSALIHELELEAPSLEGYLFPDTYFFHAGMTVQDIVSRMVSNFKVHLPDSAVERAAYLGMTLNELVALASIVEWEVLFAREAPLVSSVYHNRLKLGMPLQADPTVSYAQGRGPSRLSYSDLKVDSPYNTYLYPGLPPGAINNPGLRSIEAALNPAKTNYLYFVSQGDGTHAFSATLSEHLNAKVKLDSLRRVERDKLNSDINTNG